jgi:hypothetical protein
VVTTTEAWAEPVSGHRDDVGLWLARRLADRYAYEPGAEGTRGAGQWYWRLVSGRLHPVDSSVVASAINGELAHVYYRLIDDTTFTAQQIDRLLSPSYVESCLMPVLRMLLTVPGAEPRKPRATAPKKPKESTEPKPRQFSEASLDNIRSAAARTQARRRRCEECGMVTTPPAMGLHQRSSAHEGWTELEPA